MVRILLIDDEESISFSFRLFLEAAGYQVHTAGDFETAVDLLERNEFDVVISDLLLPGRSGLDILEWLKFSGRSIPSVLITGQPEQKTARRSFELGAFEYLGKPVRKDKLLDTIAKALHHREMLVRAESAGASPELDASGHIAADLDSAAQLFQRELLDRLPADLRTCFSSELLARMFQKSPLGVAYVEDDAVPYVNPRFTELLGYTAEDLNPVERWFEQAYPDEEVRRQAVKTTEDCYAAAEKSELAPLFIKLPISTKDCMQKMMSLCGVFLPGRRAIYSVIEAPDEGSESSS